MVQWHILLNLGMPNFEQSTPVRNLTHGTDNALMFLICCWVKVVMAML